MKRLLPILLLPACTRTVTPKHIAMKGCREEVRFERPIARGLGLSSHLELGSTPQDVAYRAYEQDRWVDLQPGVIRRDMPWTVLEPEPGRFDFGPLETVLDAVQSVDADLVALLDYGHPAYPPFDEDDAVPPEDPADFARYAGQLAGEYADDLHYYEIWNEPNAGIQFWKPREDPAAYAALVQATAPAIRAADPDATVVLGGLFWPDLFFNATGPEFLDDLAAELPQLPDLVDVISIHPYRYPFNEPELPSDRQESMVTELCDAWDQMETLGLGDHEMWIGELGWHTAPDALFPGPDADTQAAWLVRAAVLSFAQGAHQFSWYTFRDSGTDGSDQEDMFGLVGFDPDPTDEELPVDKPAFAAFATLSELLGAHDTIQDGSAELGLDAETYGYKLTGGGGVAWVLWTTGPERLVAVPAGDVVQAERVDVSGTVGIQDAVGGAFSVDVGPSPLYLRLP